MPASPLPSAASGGRISPVEPAPALHVVGHVRQRNGRRGRKRGRPMPFGCAAHKDKTAAQVVGLRA